MECAWRRLAGIIGVMAMAGCANGPAGIRTAKLSPTEQMMWSTYAVGTRDTMATCFVVGRKNPKAPGGISPTVVTSMHVLRSARNGPLFLGIRLAGKDGKPQVAIIEFSPNSPTVSRMVRHPTHDIAAFELTIPAEVARQIALPSFLNRSGIGIKGDRPRVGEEISILGFPDIYPGTAGAFPVLRGGKIASYAAGLGNDPQRFMINTNVYPGDSGGPVFASGTNGHPRLIGMVTQRVGTDPRQAVPLALAVDASVIRETLELLDQRGRGGMGD